MNSGKAMLTFVLGVTAGALAGILFAPAKGINTRKRLLTKSKDYSGALKEQSNKLYGAVAQKFDKVMDNVFYDDDKTAPHEEEVLQDSQII